MADGYWVISVNRDTGAATTSALITDRDEAWQDRIDIQVEATYTTVVPVAPPHQNDESCLAAHPTLSRRHKDLAQNR